MRTVFLLLIFSALVCADSSNDNELSVSLIGLGAMGQAVAKCFLQHGYTVHAWNRSPKDLQIDGLIVHATAREAFQATNTTLFVINSAPSLQTVHDILQDSLETLQGKVLVNLVNHEPFAAQDLETVLDEASVHHISASLFGVPETVCSPAAQLLISAPLRSTRALQEVPLTVLGRVHEFSGDVGLASLVYLCVVQSLYFGLAGYELALLILGKYGADETTLERFQELAKDLLATYVPAFLPIISNTIVKEDWRNSYVPASAAAALFEMHEIVFDRLGLLKDSFHAVYLKYLRKTVEVDGLEIGISAVVQQYSTDGYRIDQKSRSDDEL